MSIIVLGSINIDLVVQTPRIPAPAETLTGHAFFTVPGGKGANQAVAAARLGAPTKIIGRVGDDMFADDLLDSLQHASVDTTAVFRDTAVSSGVALISVDDQSQNSIIVVPGANGKVGRRELVELEQLLPHAKVLLLQLEIPLSIVETAVSLANQHSVTVILDPAPARSLPVALYQQIDYLTPNEVEAAQLVGFEIKTIDDARRAVSQFLSWGVAHPIVKLGARGVVYGGISNVPQFAEAFSVEAIDSTAAGDAFNGAVAAALASGIPVQQSIQHGMAAGAFATTKIGAQTSMPSLPELQQLLVK